jgi:hypothetical protein
VTLPGGNGPSLPEKVVALDLALAGARIEHAFGGALALAYYAEPRATIDIDVNVFCSPERHDAVERALGPLGVTVTGEAATLERDGQARWWWGRTPIDLFFAYDEIHEAMRDEVRRVQFGETRIPILGPEHLLVCKAAFDRPKDWIDIEQMLILVADLNRDEVRGWMRRIAGPDDPRTRRVEELLTRNE